MEQPECAPKEAVIPEPLTVNFACIPERLREYNHFVVWKYVIVDAEIKKPPFSPKTGRFANVRTPETWGSFQEAQQAYASGKFAGIGIVLTPAIGIVAIDIDHCVINEQPDEKAQQIIRWLNSYTELSPSGIGIRILLEGKLPAGLRRRGNVEMYEDLRYVTLTGHVRDTTPQQIQPRHPELYGLYHRVFGLRNKPATKKIQVGE